MKIFTSPQNKGVSTDNKDINLGLRLFQSSSQSKAMIDENMNIIRANDSFCALMESPIDFQSNPNLFDLPFSSGTRFKQLVQSVKAGTLKNFEFENNYCFKTGQVKSLKYKLEGIYSQNVFEGALLSITDSTRKKQNLASMQGQIEALIEHNTRLQAQVDQSVQNENIANIASSDLKVPLRMIGNFSQLISKKYGAVLDEVGQEYLSYVLDGVHNMNGMINDLLGYNNLDKIAHNSSIIETVNLIEKVELSFQSTLSEIGGSISLNSLPDTIRGDEQKLTQLFHCLIDNAIKYRDTNRSLAINVTCTEESDQWEFAIQDNGLGINEAYFTKIFKVFNKLDLNSETSGTGSGIGLAICKKIVSHHAGKIWLKSTEKEGSTFYFTLPK